MLQKYDDRNASIKVWVKDKLVDRKNAMISVFDSSQFKGEMRFGKEFEFIPKEFFA